MFTKEAFEDEKNIQKYAQHLSMVQNDFLVKSKMVVAINTKKLDYETRASLDAFFDSKGVDKENRFYGFNAANEDGLEYYVARIMSFNGFEDGMKAGRHLEKLKHTYFRNENETDNTNTFDENCCNQIEMTRSLYDICERLAMDVSAIRTRLGLLENSVKQLEKQGTIPQLFDDSPMKKI